MWDVGELAAIDPTDVSAYLRATGWRHSDDYGKTQVFSRPLASSEGHAEVLLPISSQLRDYGAWIGRLLGTLADVEQRSGGDILYELQHTRVDVQHIRTMPDGPSGTTPLTHGAKAIKGVRDLFLAAATSAVLDEPTAVLPTGRRPQLATDFVNQVRLGIPTAGSYVLRLETPIGLVGETDTTGTRNMLLHLYRSVHAAHTAAVESAQVGTPRPFERQIQHGVSSSLCGALAEIGGGPRSAFEFRFAWARTMPVSEETPDLRFDTEHVVALHDGKTHLGKLADTEPAVVTGRSTDLSHRNESIGRVILEGPVELSDGFIQQNRRVSMRLSRNEYALVVQAHQPGREARVRVSGLLRKSGRQWEMVTVDDLQILR